METLISADDPVNTFHTKIHELMLDIISFKKKGLYGISFDFRLHGFFYFRTREHLKVMTLTPEQ